MECGMKEQQKSWEKYDKMFIAYGDRKLISARDPPLVLQTMETLQKGIM